MPRDPQRDREWEPEEDLVDGAKQSMHVSDIFLTYLLERKRSLHAIRAMGPVDSGEADQFFRDVRRELASLNASERWAEGERARAERLLSTFLDPRKFSRWARELDRELARGTRSEPRSAGAGR